MTKIILKGKDKSGEIEHFYFKGEILWVKFFNSHIIYPYKKSDYKFIEIPELSPQKRTILSYLKEVAKLVGIKTDDGTNLLSHELEKINKIEPQSALFAYLQGKFTQLKNDEILIFPFGTNKSQIKATKNALNSQISIIEGPPGTGKTQSILSLIANILLKGGNVAVVSNNNAATQNVLEKLAKYELDGICAMLGKRENKDKFVQNQQENLDKIKKIKINELEKKLNLNALKQEILTLNDKMIRMFDLQNEVARLNLLLSEFKLEFKHFKRQENKPNLPKIRRSFAPNANRILYLKNEIEMSNSINFFLKLKSIFYGFGNFSFYKMDKIAILRSFEWLYYEMKIKELEKNLAILSKELNALEKEQILQKIESRSMMILRAKLIEKYKKMKLREFTQDDIFCNADKFIMQYPVILSTTHSILNALNPEFSFDFVIMDEASQVDLASGILALKVARNIVVVGDSKQLPNIITNEIKAKILPLNELYKIPKAYDYTQNSFLSSILSVFENAPKTLLQEHYRCHPKIIDFCNKKFYDDKLIILSQDKGEKDAIKLRFSVSGNHARGTFNQREIDEICTEILPEFRRKFSDDEIGIITPYNDQKSRLIATLNTPNLQIDTVHKFQGHEKEVIIMSLVKNEVDEFVDNPNLLNVAISRAKRHLVLVASPKFEDENSVIGDFIKYIKYHNFEVKQSAINSIFDLLYKDNRTALLNYLKNKKKISIFDSENIAFNFISEILANNKVDKLDIACHVPLWRILRDTQKLSEKERKFALNPLTHIDFVLYHKMDKTAILGVEIDGYAFHQKGSKQAQRDEMKDKICAKYNFALLRLNTTQSAERKRLVNAINAALNGAFYEKI